MMKLERYFTWGIYQGNEKNEEYSTRVEFGHTNDEAFILVQSINRKNILMEGMKTQYNRVLQFGIQSPEALSSIEDSITQDINSPPGTTITGHLNDVDGTYEEHLEENSKVDLNRVKIEINKNGLHFHAFENEDYLGNVLVPSSKEMRDGEMTEDNELTHLSTMLENVRSSYKEARTESPYGIAESNLEPIIDERTADVISNKKYGHEVIGHLEDGDACLTKGVLQPALASYIHAIEWASIAYLESEEDIDIIEKEKDGNLYYFAKGGNSILDELERHVEIDQKTISKIESMNRAERRWMAHHKSGETLPDEVKAVRARLGAFLETLFGRDT